MAVVFNNTAQSIVQFEDYLFRGHFLQPLRHKPASKGTPSGCPNQAHEFLKIQKLTVFLA